MKNNTVSKRSSKKRTKHDEGSLSVENSDLPAVIPLISEQQNTQDKSTTLPEILFITSYPPRECGIATYSQDLVKALNNKFSNSLSIKVCAMEAGEQTLLYPDEVKYILKTSVSGSYEILAHKINNDSSISIVVIQHEFGFFSLQEEAFHHFLEALSKPVVIVFHTVLPDPVENLKSRIRKIASLCRSVVVMTHTSADILLNHYGLPKEKISVIAHGTHLVPHLNKNLLKNKYGLKGRKVLTTFGLLSSGKSIETTLKALPAIIKANPEVLFLIIGKTHPEVLKTEGEKYRSVLEDMVSELKLTQHVKFINKYLSLPDLLEYLQLTDIYLFTSKDPNQAVSGTFSYAMSCGCPIISTPIPHAKEVLTGDTGIIIDFQNSVQLAEGVIRLLGNTQLRRSIRVNALQKIVPTAWENSAVEHTMLFRKISGNSIKVQYDLPPVNLNHIKEMTTETGIIQFSKVNQPDLCSGYTLDDNARAMIAMCKHFILTQNKESRWYISKYLSFIKLCQQPSGDFLNYVNIENEFTVQNWRTSLDDANGRALWALGYILSEKEILPEKISSAANDIFQRALPHIETILSPRAIAFAIKGLYFHHKAGNLTDNISLLKTLANRLVKMYKQESTPKWKWFEDSLTYANSILPEAMLYAWVLTGDKRYREIAVTSFDFLLSVIFNENGIEVVSNRSWLKKGHKAAQFGEQPIDVAYTIMTLSNFYDVFGDKEYLGKLEIAFSWFLGNNRLHQIIYNPRTGGCYDGLEENHVNLNQGAESSISYLLARLTIERFKNPDASNDKQSLLFEGMESRNGKAFLPVLEGSLAVVSDYSAGDIEETARKTRNDRKQESNE